MGKGKKNKVLKLIAARVKYIIRAKTNNISSRIIAAEMKVSIRTVNRVWMHWTKIKTLLSIKKFGGKKRPVTMNPSSLYSMYIKCKIRSR